MTAEIAILNKSGIVLASDSASTIGGNKVYNTAKKLFALENNHSIGIMVYGSAEFMGVPWEIIIGQYRKNIGNETCSSLEAYCESFFIFLKEQNYLKSQNLQDNFVLSYAHSVISTVFQNTEDDINFLISQGQNIDSETFIKLLLESISIIKTSFDSSDTIIDINEEQFTKTYKERFKDILFNISTYEDVSEGIFPDLLKLIYYTIIRNSSFLSSTGIVIAGYGDSEIFPSLQSFHLYGFVMDNLKFSLYQKATIGTNNGELDSSIIPFAQDDVVNTVVQGIDPQFSEFLASKIQVFDDYGKEKYNEIIEELSVIQQKFYIEPLLNMIGLLPVDETAIIAETLLNLTSFKRKYTSSVETVGGPIDVLSITPNEGPIWIKRKHYFDINDNIGYQIRRNQNAKHSE